MSEIDVEAVEDIDDDAVPSGVDAPEYVLYGGKGGVGKTTMAAATALASARDGTETLVVSTDPAHSLSDTLETEIPAEPARIREDVPLYAAEIDPEAALEDGPFAEDGGLGGAGGAMGGLGEMLGGAGEGMVDPLGGSMPGADEAAAIRLLIRYMDDPRFDRVVVDTAPTGHTLRLLELPDVMDSMLGKVLAMRERMGGMMENLGGMFGGDDEDVDPEEGLDDLRVLSDRIEQLRDVLQDPTQTDFRVVMVPEELSVLESERLLDRLDEFDVPVGTVVVNRVMQDLTDVADTDADWFVSPDLDDCEFCQRRWDVQRDALSRSQEVFRGHDVRRVPLFAEEVHGERTLRIVAACLEE
ncbi:TRC40/GET3/ArsA family transport-energizing ATPase [Halosimplex litoreum]|uniref:TRC40/GET3/ArsA family transport-energizing ATPase n=1 Tax=Halosimplex litoreum TaxID=1198301 RepID=A0A7T3KUE2_9EURY|nr:TRC40/GET3/ArsA family transport-energizing ATPase [Halosimplex litoreum]QPV61665.1 TRC40/GET3/ArsA family transport-energizing ATPase [Halosimplex litoreum]